MPLRKSTVFIKVDEVTISGDIQPVVREVITVGAMVHDLYWRIYIAEDVHSRCASHHPVWTGALYDP